MKSVSVKFCSYLALICSGGISLQVVPMRIEHPADEKPYFLWQ